MDTPVNALKDLLALFSFGKMAAIAGLFLVSWLLLLLLRAFLVRLAVQFPRYRLLLNRFYPVTRAVVWIAVVLYAVVGILNPHQGIVIAVLGTAGLAFGLAAQDPIKNLVAGLIITLNPPYRVGDMVSLAGHYGEVIALEWSVTWLRTFDDNTIMVPNSVALHAPVSNANSGALDELVSVSFTLSAKVDHTKAMSLAREATLCSPYTFLKKPVGVQLETQHDWGEPLIVVIVKAYVLDVRFEKKFATDINIRVLDAFKTAGLLPVEYESLAHG